MVNRRLRFRPLLTQARLAIGSRYCPDCGGGRGPRCRQHRLAGGDPTSELGHDLAAVAVGLKRLVNSLTVDGAPALSAERASWAAAVGWFAGWAPVLGDQTQSGGRAGRHDDPPAASGIA
jgi:hypothetical protein